MLDPISVILFLLWTSRRRTWILVSVPVSRDNSSVYSPAPQRFKWHDDTNRP